MSISIHTEETINAMLAAGKPHAEIAAAAGLSISSIEKYKRKNRDKIQIYIEKIYNRLPDVLELDFNLIRLANRAARYLVAPDLVPNNTALTNNRDLLAACKQGVEVGREYKQSVGVAPSHTQAPAVVTFNQQNNYGPLSSSQLEFLQYKRGKEKALAARLLAGSGVLPDESQVIDIKEESAE